MTLKTVIEALVFASPKPLLTKEILAALKAAGEGTESEKPLEYAKVKEADVLAALEELQVELSTTGRAFQVVERVTGWTLVTDPSCAPWVRQLYPEAKPTRLSGPQLETLAIIAYRQPVTRADCEAVRGVAVDGVMQVLLDRGLVKIAGRAEVPGRPLLYCTTAYFLDHFGLKTTDDLPNAGELKRVVLPKAEVPEEKEKAKPATRGGKAAETGEKPAEASTEAVSTEGTAEAAPEAAAEAAAEVSEAPAEHAVETPAEPEAAAAGEEPAPEPEAHVEVEHAEPEPSEPAHVEPEPSEPESSEPEPPAETHVAEPETPVEPPAHE